MKYQPSSIYLSGNKVKLLKDILPHIEQSGRDIIIEPFVGTGVVSLACIESGIASQSYGNDIMDWVVNLHNRLKDPKFILEVSKVNTKYKNTETDYLKLKDTYNKGGCKNHAELFCLMLRGNSNRVRFSGRGKTLKHNIPWGKRNPFNMERMLRHHTLSQNMTVTQGSFATFLHGLEDKVDWNDTVVYLDSPYQTGGKSGGAVYNAGWSDIDDDVLLDCLLKYQQKGAKVICSNVHFNRGFLFQKLIDFCEEHSDKFDTYHLDMDYRNTSAYKYDGDKTDEVLIVSK